ncbi:hypothetical protein BHM03_00011741 [Ensete ventricosum]|nr:hypothetical protein BHM03_00011741 [Ensete ventricosum]
MSKSLPASEPPNAKSHSRSRRERARRTRNPKSTRETRNRKKTKRTNSKKSKRRRKKSPETPKSAVKSEPRLIKRRTEAKKPGPEIHPPAGLPEALRGQDLAGEVAMAPHWGPRAGSSGNPRKGRRRDGEGEGGRGRRSARGVRLIECAYGVGEG